VPILGALVAGACLVFLLLRARYYDRYLTGRIQWYMALSRRNKALPLLERVLRRLRKKKGENHLDTAVSKYTLGEIHYRRALRAVDLRRELDGEDTGELALTLSNLGAVLDDDGRQRAAEVREALR